MNELYTCGYIKQGILCQCYHLITLDICERQLNHQDAQGYYKRVELFCKTKNKIHRKAPRAKSAEDMTQINTDPVNPV